MSQDKIYAIIDYEDAYVQPLLLSALQSRLPQGVLVLINDPSELPSPTSKLLQWRQYESIDFENLMVNPETSLANSYVIRKALIRKHYLSSTISHWLSKNPDSVLANHVKSSVEFEVDYAEFLDDALVEAWELKASWERNEALELGELGREWWILKPGMSERGQGIRLFSSEEELTEIFEEWDPPSDDEEDDEDDPAHSGDEANGKSFPPQTRINVEDDEEQGNGVMTSQLRHFIAQPYIDPPLLLPNPHPSANRKFHIRTYVLAVGALQIYVYKPMLALFAGQPYTAPGAAPASSSNHQTDEPEPSPNTNLAAHLTNTCLQTGEREGSVHAFWSLPSTLPGLPTPWRETIFTQIQQTTAEIFLAAARSMSIHFQTLPNAFEIFGLDFMVDAAGKTWLLEVNAFPDFAQTGDKLSGVVEGLMEAVVDVAVAGFYGVDGEKKEVDGEKLVKVLDVDLGRR
ncbi:putative tubulin--tyrosine ligase [Acrodontium crateriforme]|uniref:Tubulin--tyrosine ligase n=1 Tax=Acrodontium crateriforme TaxID=150365 RepID=A0AAQ3M782_9PEZI|nr:putative tubulin--tyrosine ligase [Acrodontium crateriforme]